jgi:hypothetical protein
MTRTPTKAAVKKAAPRKRPAKKAAAKKAAPPVAERPPQPTVQIEVRVDNRIVCLQDVEKSSVKVSLKDGHLSVAATTGDAAPDTQPAEQPVEQRLVDQLQPEDPPTSEQFDNIVATGVPNKAVEFHQDPRVAMQIHEGEPVVEKQAREAKGK